MDSIRPENPHASWDRDRFGLAFLLGLGSLLLFTAAHVLAINQRTHQRHTSSPPPTVQVGDLRSMVAPVPPPTTRKGPQCASRNSTVWSRRRLDQ
jgi:hypothetical protein